MSVPRAANPRPVAAATPTVASSTIDGSGTPTRSTSAAALTPAQVQALVSGQSARTTALGARLHKDPMRVFTINALAVEMLRAREMTTGALTADDVRGAFRSARAQVRALPTVAG